MLSHNKINSVAPVGIYSAYLEAHQRGKERVHLVAGSAIREFDTLISELEGEIGNLNRQGKPAKAQVLEKTLHQVQNSRNKTVKQRDKMIRRMDRQWQNASRGSIDHSGLNDLKNIFYADFLEYRGSLVRKIQRINTSALIHIKTDDRKQLPELSNLVAHTNRKKIEKLLNHLELPGFGKVKKVIALFLKVSSRL